MTGPCVCGHRKPVAHPNGGACFDNVKSVMGKSQRCPCKKFTEAKP